MLVYILYICKYTILLYGEHTNDISRDIDKTWLHFCGNGPEALPVIQNKKASLFSKDTHL